MWSAQFVTNIGGWMQTVAAQWLMLSLTTSRSTSRWSRRRPGCRWCCSRCWRGRSATWWTGGASCSGHLRQHERVTTRDQARLDRVRELADPARPPEVTHWL